MSKKQKMEKRELEKVHGGGFSPGEWEEIRKNAEKRETCANCGKKFSEAQHKKIPLPPIMNVDLQKRNEIEWCGDCIHNYWEKYGKGLNKFIFGKPLK